MRQRHGPATADTESALLERVLKISSLTVSGVVEENAALREAAVRLKELASRMPSTDMKCPKAVVASMIYANFLGPVNSDISLRLRQH